MPPRKTGRKKQSGKGVMDTLSSVNKFLKDSKLISSGLKALPNPYAQVAGQGAAMLGYGRKRPRKMKGRGVFSDLGGGIGSVFGGLGSGIGSVAHGFFGSGRQHGGAVGMYRPAIVPYVQL